MKRLKFVLLSNEEDYALSFAKYVGNHFNTQIAISLCYDLDDVAVMDIAGFSPEVLLVTEEQYVKSCEEEKDLNWDEYGENIWILSSGKYLEIANISPYKVINRNLSIKEIIDTIIQELIDKGKYQTSVIEKSKAASVIAVTSLSDVDNCISLSFNLAKKLQKNDKNVLIVSMENFCCYEELFNQEFDQGLFTELNLFADLTSGQKGNELLFNLETAIIELGGIDLIALSKLTGEACNLKKDEIKELINVIHLLKRYDYIIISCPDFMPITLCETRALVDKFLIVRTETKMDKRRYTIFIDEYDTYLEMNFKKMDKSNSFIEIIGTPEEMLERAVRACE